MPEVAGITFKRCGKIYDFEIDGIEVKKGDQVIVESDFGLSIGTVVRGSRAIDAPERELKKILRPATEEDFRAREENVRLEKEARAFCAERVMARGLPMKLVGAESTLDRKRIIFYFTADGRIDFRELVKDLAARFKTRIEMRQIGVRDEAKLVGGVGICGRELCCNTFLSSFDPVSIKMAKRQELVLNVGKLSGLCSRLMCCLRYEYEGDLNTIASDDEIPIGVEDVPIAAIEEKISTIIPKMEAPHKTSNRVRPSPHRRDRKRGREVSAGNSQSGDSKATAGQQVQPPRPVQSNQPNQPVQPDQANQQEKKRVRHRPRRRSFKK
ncbi:MAG: stage 0 sporulation family protein [Nitrospirae bacterium]|nr:stage 0 sporulation family protein [Nitrospirota bacterium]